MINFTNVHPVSPVSQDFIWLAEYANGEYLAEYDFVTKKESDFHDIKKDVITRFGLVGHGMKLYFESYGGYFKLADTSIEVVYKTEDKEYPLTGQKMMYTDIIQYKEAETIANFATGQNFGSRITQFNFGYKNTFNIDGVNFHFKAICKIPFDKPAYVSFTLVADQELDGVLEIRKNGLFTEQFDAPLSKGIGGELNWLIQ